VLALARSLALALAPAHAQLVPHYCNLLRNAQSLQPLANTLLPGDVITLTVGDRVPADVRLVAATGLEIDESALTGETKPAKKGTEACGVVNAVGGGVEGEGASLGGRRCVAFMGTLVRSGECGGGGGEREREMDWERDMGRG
jgi:Ca2+-transporting ATPase